MFVLFGEGAVGCEAAEFDAGPEGAEDEPVLTLRVAEEVGVDGVEVVARAGFQDKAAIGPSVVGAGAVECLVGGKRDAGGVLAEEREGIVEAVLAVDEGDVGGPEVLNAGETGEYPRGD